jgi:hypothetical protein
VEWHELVTVFSYFFAFLPIVETAFMEQNILQETFGKQRDYLKSHPTFRYCDLCEVWGMHSSFMSAIFKACEGTGFRATYFQIYPFGSGCTKHRDDSQKLILKVDGVLRFWDGSQVSLQEINCTGTIGLIDTIGGGGALTGYTARPAHPNEDHDDDDDGNNISLEPNHILHKRRQSEFLHRVCPRVREHPQSPGPDIESTTSLDEVDERETCEALD